METPRCPVNAPPATGSSVWTGFQMILDAQPDIEGDVLISPSVTARLVDAFTSGEQRTAEEPLDSITEREEEVLAGVARGLTNQELAEELFISLSTAKTHVASLMTKLGSRNRVELVIWAYESGRA
jgi:DNA-binding NarL/FixJ family response regulator